MLTALLQIFAQNTLVKVLPKWLKIALLSVAIILLFGWLISMAANRYNRSLVKATRAADEVKTQIAVSKDVVKIVKTFAKPTDPSITDDVDWMLSEFNRKEYELRSVKGDTLKSMRSTSSTHLEQKSGQAPVRHGGKTSKTKILPCPIDLPDKTLQWGFVYSCNNATGEYQPVRSLP